MSKRLHRFIFQGTAAFVFFVGGNLLFFFQGPHPEEQPTAYQLLLSVLCCLDVPILACVAGYRNWKGAIWGYGAGAALQMVFSEVFGAALYGMALWFEHPELTLRLISAGSILLTFAAYLLGRRLRIRGFSIPGES